MNIKTLCNLSHQFYSFAANESDYHDISFHDLKVQAAKEYIRKHFPDVYDTLWDEESQEIHFDDPEYDKLANESREEILNEIYRDNGFREFLQNATHLAVDTGNIEIQTNKQTEETGSIADINWLDENEEEPEPNFELNESFEDQQPTDNEEVDQSSTDLDDL